MESVAPLNVRLEIVTLPLSMVKTNDVDVPSAVTDVPSPSMVPLNVDSAVPEPTS
jgi:hypothetical protein